MGDLADNSDEEEEENVVRRPSLSATPTEGEEEGEGRKLGAFLINEYVGVHSDKVGDPPCDVALLLACHPGCGLRCWR